MSGPPQTQGTLLSSVHGRDRRALRKISKKDLLAAVKFGKRENAYPCRATGERRLKYTFADIVYITDITSKREITSYVLPIEIPKVPLPDSDVQTHEKWTAVLRANPAMCTSHIVLCVDMSGSMRTSDVMDYRCRSDAVFGTIALDLIGKSLDSGIAVPTTALTLIEFNDISSVTIDREPVTNVLFNKFIDKRSGAKARSHGNYAYALEACEKVLEKDLENGSCSILLLFLSDGKPSDRQDYLSSYEDRFGQKMFEICSKFKKQMVVGTIGFAAEGTDFSVLSEMAKQATKAGCFGQFERSGASSAALSSAVSLLGTKLSATQSRLSALAITRLTGRGTVRTIQRESHHAALATSSLQDWNMYTVDVNRYVWIPVRGRNGGGYWKSVPFVNPTSVGLAIRMRTFGQGAERVVFQTREVARNQSGQLELVGDQMVAKESLHVEFMELKREFHRVFCYTQIKAKSLAKKFNEQLRRAYPNHRNRFPVIDFLDCFVYNMSDPSSETGYRGVLVEKMLDPEKYIKWNGNDGSIKGVYHGALAMEHFIRDATKEPCQDNHVVPDATHALDSDSEDESTGTADPPAPSANAFLGNTEWDMEDFPQAFSHWTYRSSNRKLLVCDLQGVLDISRQPAVFEWTDPVIHYSSFNRKNVFGRTDHGEEGFRSFFKTHTCNRICRLLGLSREGK